MQSFRLNLTFAILSSLACLLILTWLLLSIISFKTAEKDLLVQKREQGRVLLTTFIDTLSFPLSRENGIGDPFVHRFIGTLAREKDFQNLLVIDGNGDAVYFSHTDRRVADDRLLETLKTGLESYRYVDNGASLIFYAPVYRAETVVGAARLMLSFGPERARLQRSQKLFMTYFALDFLLILAIGSLLLRRIVVLPISRLLTATERITAGDYSHAVHVPGCAEIADLADSFNVMQSTLQNRREEIEAHVKSLEMANKALETAREETIRSEKMASVGLLAAGMAHEIGTPLAAIIGYGGILSEELAGDPEKVDYVRRIAQEAGRIDRLVRELLDFARPKKAEIESVDVAQLVAETLEMLTRQGIFKRLEIKLNTDDQLPRLLMDRSQFMQVLINLFINARDAMPEGGTLRVSVTAKSTVFQAPLTAPRAPANVVGRRREDFGGIFQQKFQESEILSPGVVIEVSDTGEGIAPDNLGKVFDPFFTTKAPGKGTGLGLAISARIVDSFGGRIYVQSELGKGTSFTIVLPASTFRLTEKA